MKTFLNLYNIEDSLNKCLREFFKSINKNIDSYEFLVQSFFHTLLYVVVLLASFCTFSVIFIWSYFMTQEYSQKSISSCKLQQYVLAKILIMECRWHDISCFRVNSFC